MASPQRPIIYTEQEKDNRKSAHALTVDTLKTYINFSSLAIAGLLGFLASKNLSEIHWTFYVSLACFFACALLSVIIINIFIVQVFDGIWNVLDNAILWLTRTAIALFFAGIIFGAINIIHDKRHENKKSETKIILPDSSRLVLNIDTCRVSHADSSKCCNQKIEYCKCPPNHKCGPRCKKR